MARRARNEGSIRHRPDGLYEIRVVDPLSGRRASLYATTEAEALERLKAARSVLDDGAALGGVRLTLGAYVHDWLASVTGTVRPTTHAKYEERLRLHVVEHLGNVRLRALTPLHLRKLYNETLPASGLSPRSIVHVHRAVSLALAHAASDGLVSRNVAALVKPPRVPSSEMASLDSAQAGALLDAAVGDRMEAMYAVALTTGMRLGELLGLRWSDVDFDAGTIRVRRTLARIVKGQALYHEPKTTAGARVITLSRVAKAALRGHRQRQLEERLAAIGWEDADLIFPDKIGRPYYAGHFYRDSWETVKKTAKLAASVTFHATRHTAASLTLAAGVPVATVSAMLGHANPSITMRLYAHAIPGTQQQAADAMDALLGARAGS